MFAKNVVIRGIKDVFVAEREIDAENLKPHECLIETYVSLISAGTELSRPEKRRGLSGESRVLFRRKNSKKRRGGISGGGRGRRLVQRPSQQPSDL
jgi:hypothetical protein